MDRHIVKYIVGQRKTAIEANPELFQTERWDHSDVFYAARTWLNQHNWNTSVYNDNTVGGADRRDKLYKMIRPVCEDFYGVKRHQIGIYPDDRAVMAYNGTMYAASFDNLGHLMHKGTDVICVEKQGTVIKMMPFTRNNGVAFIQSQGFISEYGIALARLTNRDFEAGEDYLGKLPSPFKGNLGNLTDCDSSGMVIGMKVLGDTRLGIDLDTIDEIIEANKGSDDDLGIGGPLKLELTELQESNDINSHWHGLKGIINGAGDLYDSLSVSERVYYRRLLTSRPNILAEVEDMEGMTYLEYLQEHRIELNTVLAIIKPQAFWNWLRWKILQIWPKRDYIRGGLWLTDSFLTPTMNRFKQFCIEQTDEIVKDRITEERRYLREVKGMYDDTGGFQDSVPLIKKVIMGDIMNEVVLPNETIQKLDQGLEKIMKNGNGTTTKKQEKKSKKEQQAEAYEDTEEYDDDYDGNEWDE